MYCGGCDRLGVRCGGCDRVSGGGYDCVVEGVIGPGYCGGCNCLGVSGGGCDWLQVENMSVLLGVFFVCVCVCFLSV